MYKKLVLIILTLCFVYILGTGVFAAPQAITQGTTGNAQIIDVTNPVDCITTFKNHVVVSVTGNEGVIVTLYTFDPNVNNYVIYTDKLGETSWNVGPSGLFIKRLPIVEGVNYMGVYAEYNDTDQFVSRRVDGASRSLCDGLRAILINSVEDIVQTMGE